MSSVIPITGAVAVAMMLAASPSALSAQVTSNQDTTRAPWPVNRGPTVFGGRGQADTATSSNTTVALAADSAIIRQAINGNALEVQLGRVADDRADDSAVEDFGKRMVSDHGALGQDWSALARTQRTTVNTDLTAGQKIIVERLKGLSGRTFDSTYMADMIRLHERDLAAFDRAATGARSTEVRQLAATSVTTIREHLALARQVGSRFGAGTIAALPADTSRGRIPVPVRRDRDERNARNDERDNRAELRGEDRAFVMEVMSDHLMEIRLAERAKREAKDDDTRRFASQLLDDFTKWQDKWEDLAKRRGLEPPKGLGKMHDQKVKQLEKASKREFDRVYLSLVGENLSSIVPYFEKEGRAVRVAAVRRLADDELPVIRQYMNRAKRLQGQASAQANRDGRN
jgi:putative membrane protein